MLRRSGFALLLIVSLCACDDAPPPVTGGPGTGPDGDMPCGPPVDEVCNGQDDDCDGDIDEQVAGIGAQCGSPACGLGSTACVDGELVCVGEGAPSPESCNGEDDDCDGIIDEEAMEAGGPCDTCPGVFQCVGGDLVCSGGSQETCNGQDDDCDGRTDEDLTRPCGDGTGACEPGVEACQNGQWGGCMGGVGPNGEECNGLDDDCDGTVDEGIADCAGIGSPCRNDADCSTGRCIDDDGSRYCSRGCDPAAADDCGAGLRCVELPNGAVCIPEFTPCTSDCDCAEPGHACMPATNLADVEYACRPERLGGAPVGAECDPRASECATGLCLGRIRRCGRLCCDQASCDEGAACVALPGVDEPVCVTACNGDADCPARAPDSPYAQEICRYRPDVEMTRNLGICDWPNQGGPDMPAGAVGDPCERGGDCAHGLCWQPNEGDNYCTRGCEDVADCPEGWVCRGTRLNGLDVNVCRQ